MAIQIKNTKDYVLNGVKVTVYGEAGAGKTYLMQTAPKPFILSAESGLLSLQGLDIPYANISNLTDLEDAFEWATGEGYDQYDTLCLDSISEIAEIILAEEKKKSKDPRQAYGTLIDKYLALLRAFRDIPGKNVVFSAKMEKAQQSDGAFKYSMMLPGSKAGQQTPYFFDEVFVLHIITDPDTQTKNRWLQTEGDNQYVAKDRSGKLDPFEPADLSHVFNKIKGGLDEAY